MQEKTLEKTPLLHKLKQTGELKKGKSCNNAAQSAVAAATNTLAMWSSGTQLSGSETANCPADRLSSRLATPRNKKKHIQRC